MSAKFQKRSQPGRAPEAIPAGPPEFLRHEAFSELDRHFALFLARLSSPAPAELALAAALVSRSRGEGHTCLDLRRVAGTSMSKESRGHEPTAPSWERRHPAGEIHAGRMPALPARFMGIGQGGATLELPDFDSWIELLKKCAVVGQPGEFKPLVLDGQGRIYLHRYWQYESNLAEAISRRVMDVAEPADPAWLGATLKRYFPPIAGAEIDWQKVAAFTALTRRLCVISGGPGTGKTRTVAMLLAMLLEQAGERPLRIALTAPTGKAAARLQESIKQARATLPCADSVKARLPDDAATVHRLLGAMRDSASFKHDAANPLPFDVVVIDEASMVDLALMAKLFDAVPPTARVILLGDKDQLASVEAGAVLADICPGERANGFSAGVRTQYRLVTGEELPAAGATALGDCIVQLQRNYRFGSDNGILALSRAVNDGDADLALRLLRERTRDGGRRREEAVGTCVREGPPPHVGGYGDASGLATAALPGAARLKENLQPRVLAGFAGVLKAPDARAALAALGRFRILCALRQGPFGVENVNRLVEEILREASLLPPRERWYAGRPVMVLRNDYDLRLFNGDIGIIRRDLESGQPRAYFLDANQELRGVAPARLPEHETVFAMTVHKSQGSEFDEVLLVLPDRENPVLTRELIYTGITRASRRVELWLDEPVLRAAVARRVERASGLRERLWGARPPSAVRAAVHSEVDGAADRSEPGSPEPPQLP